MQFYYAPLTGGLRYARPPANPYKPSGLNHNSRIAIGRIASCKRLIQILGIVFNAGEFQQLNQFLLKRLLPMMFALVGDIPANSIA